MYEFSILTSIHRSFQVNYIVCPLAKAHAYIDLKELPVTPELLSSEKQVFLRIQPLMDDKKIPHTSKLHRKDIANLDVISDQCGFASHSRFSYAFKDYYKLTPGEFRKAIKSQ